MLNYKNCKDEKKERKKKNKKKIACKYQYKEAKRDIDFHIILVNMQFTKSEGDQSGHDGWGKRMSLHF